MYLLLSLVLIAVLLGLVLGRLERHPTRAVAWRYRVCAAVAVLIVLSCLAATVCLLVPLPPAYSTGALFALTVGCIVLALLLATDMPFLRAAGFAGGAALALGLVTVAMV